MKLKHRVMKRVFRFWFLRSIMPLFAIEFIGGIVAVYFFANLIFVGAVVDNALKAALGNPLRLIGYLWISFLNTQWEVQVILVALFIASGMILRDLNRSILSYLVMRRSELLSK